MRTPSTAVTCSSDGSQSADTLPARPRLMICQNVRTCDTYATKIGEDTGRYRDKKNAQPFYRRDALPFEVTKHSRESG